mmetsp:Transcript_50293/g.96061  ORF Transcript_50293/g.96061 Transcript_50293/m.96061 type:complete len:262 (+) Transcript_50293:410-1195(+)
MQRRPPGHAPLVQPHVGSRSQGDVRKVGVVVAAQFAWGVERVGRLHCVRREVHRDVHRAGGGLGGGCGRRVRLLLRRRAYAAHPHRAAGSRSPRRGALGTNAHHRLDVRLGLVHRRPLCLQPGQDNRLRRGEVKVQRLVLVRPRHPRRAVHAPQDGHRAVLAQELVRQRAPSQHLTKLGLRVVDHNFLVGFLLRLGDHRHGRLRPCNLGLEKSSRSHVLIDFLHYRGGALLEYCFLAGQAPGALGRHAQWSTAEAARTIAW